MFEGTQQSRSDLTAQKGQLFGSPIFEYDVIDDQKPPDKRCHILVWLDTLNRLNEVYYPFINLLCCRSTILYAYYESRRSNNNARGLYRQLEKQAKVFSELPEERPERLQELNKLLTQMPKTALEYTRYQRNLKDYSTTIATNADNYSLCLEEICQQSLKDESQSDDLQFLQRFLQHTRSKLQGQVKIDLSYLTPGNELFQTIIDTSIGIVEIDAQQQAHEDAKNEAERDRKLQNQLRESEEKRNLEREANEAREKERDRRLELWIAVVGSGLAVSGISAEVNPRPVEAIFSQLHPDGTQQPWPTSEIISIFDILLHILVGVIGAFLLRPIIKQLVPDQSKDVAQLASEQPKSPAQSSPKQSKDATQP